MVMVVVDEGGGDAGGVGGGGVGAGKSVEDSRVRPLCLNSLSDLFLCRQLAKIRF